MRTFGTFSTTLGVTLLLGAGWMAGCQDRAGDCDLNGTCPTDAASTSSTSSGGGGGNGAGGDGGGGTDPGNCDPAMGVVDDGCGVFASSGMGADGALGGKTTPVRSLQEAVDLASETKRVYACAEVFDEAVTVAEGITIYGGLDCANDWALLAETKTTVAAPSDAIALTVESTAAGLVVNDLAMEATNATAPGGSSIAVLVDGVEATFVRCAMTARDGAAGVDGVDGPSVAPMQGKAGAGGSAACSANPVPGAPQTDGEVCGDGALSIGGKGGDGNNANGGDGANGLPVSAGNGFGGTGEVGAGWNCNVGGVNGGAQAGDNGTEGTPGVGASGPGTLTSTGYQGTSGTAGMPGTVGQGGGGGGGAKGGNGICMGGPGAGASGGAGGAGGCGGLPGEGAGPGGASFALVSVNATVTLDACVLQSGSGGAGGVGGDFQPGALGGLGGVGGDPAGGTNPGCSGGQGGKGGNGGPGGGGLGGPSAAIAHVGGAPEQAGGTTLTPGTAGLGGAGGNVNAKANAGANGTSTDVMSF